MLQPTGAFHSRTFLLWGLITTHCTTVLHFRLGDILTSTIAIHILENYGYFQASQPWLALAKILQLLLLCPSDFWGFGRFFAFLYNSFIESE